MWDVEYTDEFDEWWNGLTEGSQEDIAAMVGLLEEQGTDLKHPYSKKIRGSRHNHMRALRVRRRGRQLRVFYAFDPRRVAILLIGGDRTIPQFFRRYVKKANRLYDEHLETLKKKGLIP